MSASTADEPRPLRPSSQSIYPELFIGDCLSGFIAARRERAGVVCYAVARKRDTSREVSVFRYV
jgi:hypothetical protein